MIRKTGTKPGPAASGTKKSAKKAAAVKATKPVSADAPGDQTSEHRIRTEGPSLAPSAAQEVAQTLGALRLAVTGLSPLLSGTAPLAKVETKTRQLLDQLDDAFPDSKSLEGLSGPAGLELIAALAALNGPIYAQLGELADKHAVAIKAKKGKDARAIEGAYRGLATVAQFGAGADAHVAGQIPTEQASKSVLSLCSGSECLALAQAMAGIANATSLSTDEVANALQWLVGTKSEIGLGDPQRLYAAVTAQQQGLPAKTPGGFTLPQLPADALIRSALGSVELMLRVGQEATPSTTKAFIGALEAALEVRTSATHPLQVAWVPTQTPGKLAVTLAPGKTQPSLYDYFWKRDLDVDLKALKKDFGIDVLVPLIEDHELETLRIPNLVSKAEAHGLSVRRLQIPDQHTPSLADANALTKDIVKALEAGQNVLIHCKGGLGRAGSVAAATLVRLGVGVEDAVDLVREARPGAIENRKQELFLIEFAKQSAH